MLAAMAGSIVDPTGFLQTDAGNALLFVAMFREEIRYVEAWKLWAQWNERRWELLTDTAILPLARRVTEHMFEWAPSLPEDRCATLRKHALATQKEQRLHAMINLAKGDARILVEPRIFDANPWLLGCENVTLDLLKHRVREPRRNDFITKSTGIVFHLDAKCPNWEAMLDWALDNDAATIDHLQLVAGYMMTGDVSEEKLFAFFGGGANGKTTIAMTLFEALGEYALAEQIRQILVDEQDHQIDLATALGEDVPDLTGPRAAAGKK